MADIKFLGGPLCGGEVRGGDYGDIIATPAGVATKPLLGTDGMVYKEVDVESCPIGPVESIRKPRHVYEYDGSSFFHGPRFRYLGMQS